MGKRASGQIGPRNTGTRHKPRYRELDVLAWRAKYQGESHVRTVSADQQTDR